MSAITIDVPKWTEKVYETFIHSVVDNYSASEIEDFLLWLHMMKNIWDNEFVSEKEVFNVLQK